MHAFVQVVLPDGIEPLVLWLPSDTSEEIQGKCSAGEQKVPCLSLSDKTFSPCWSGVSVVYFFLHVPQLMPQPLRQCLVRWWWTPCLPAGCGHISGRVWPSCSSASLGCGWGSRGRVRDWGSTRYLSIVHLGMGIGLVQSPAATGA